MDNDYGGISHLSFLDMTKDSSTNAGASAGSASAASNVAFSPQLGAAGQDEDDEDEESELDVGREDFAEHAPFGGDIPRLSVSMTPWRRKSLPRQSSALSFDHSMPDSRQVSEAAGVAMDSASPVNSRPRTGSSLFSEDYLSSAPTAIVSASGNNEVEHLQKQLTACRLRLRILTELLKERDPVASETGSRTQIYEKLINTLPKPETTSETSKELTNLRRNLEDKNKELIELKQELISTKNEYNTVLDDVNSYIEHSDVIAGNIDELLVLFLENLTLSVEEIDALEKARGISNNFIDVKMNALRSTLIKFLRAGEPSPDVKPIKDADEDASTTFSEKSQYLSQTLDTRLEGAIESMHEEYLAFLESIEEKMAKSASIEQDLGVLLEKQNTLISQFGDALCDREAAAENQLAALRIEGQGSMEKLANNVKLVERFGERDIHAKQDGACSDFDVTGGSVNGLTKTDLKDLSSDSLQKKVLLPTQRSRDDLKRMHQQEQEEWITEKQDITNQLWAARGEVEELKGTVQSLQTMVSSQQADSDSIIENLEKTIKRAVRKSGLYINENRNLQEHITVIESELKEAIEQNRELERSTNRYGKEFAELQQEFQKLRNHLLLHLNKVFDVFDKILQKHSIDQARNKLRTLEGLSPYDNYRATHAKLESLYVFIETAINSVVGEHTKVILKLKERPLMTDSSQGHDSQSSQIRIELLERKWVAERERRKLDADAAEHRISQLEEENKMLRQRLRESLHSRV
ncbi:LADA_0A08658g1_1 [Lachancea dasiensis]|uniref:LADA_0A08658g1_1 n=1 Tax=Lachancea dasiensis TaxID=1072105 RepID=A0A1G4IQF6_9SACH|nr:LADA_0A08658g1_1 [Lachancea dasiensis]